MELEYITVAEYSHIKGISKQAVYKRLNNQKLKVVQPTIQPTNNRERYISITELSEEEREKVKKLRFCSPSVETVEQPKVESCSTNYSTNNSTNQTTAQDKESGAAFELLKEQLKEQEKTLQILTEQLQQKDKQISELTEIIKANQILLLHEIKEPLQIEEQKENLKEEKAAPTQTRVNKIKSIIKSIIK